MNLKTSVLVIILSILFSSLYAQDPGTYLYRKMDTSKLLEEYGYANSEGKMIIPFGKYPYVYMDTMKTIGFVRTNKRGIWAINTKGQELFRGFTLDNGPDYVQEGLFRMYDKRGKIGFANMLGKIIIQPQYEGAFPFTDGLAPVCKGCISQKVPNGEYYQWAKGKWGYIDKTGKVVIPIEYDELHYSGKPVDGKIILKKDNVTYQFDMDSVYSAVPVTPHLH